MSLLQTLNPNPFPFPTSIPSSKKYFSYQWNQLSSSHTKHLLPRCSSTSNSNPNPKSPNPQNPKPQNSRFTTPPPQPSTNESFPTTIPPKSRRGRKSEATHVEDFIRKSLSQTFESIRNQNPDTQFENALKDKGINPKDDEDDDVEKNEEVEVVEEEETNWPLDADIGLGIRASEYFDEHPIRNTVTDDGVEIDWEGEMDDTYVKEINCLEWESIAYHPSPLMVLVFERYNRASDNWKVLKELEKAIKVYWFAKDKLPPRTVKIDINIEKDLAYALKVKECPQLLFLRGNMILYREKESRTADELVQMIAHFYYNAKKPAWIDDTALAPRYSR